MVTLTLMTVPSPKLINFPKLQNWVILKNKQHHGKVLLNSFAINGHTLGLTREKKS